VDAVEHVADFLGRVPGDVAGSASRPNMATNAAGMSASSSAVRGRSRSKHSRYWDDARCPTCQATCDTPPGVTVNHSVSGTAATRSRVYRRAKSICSSASARRDMA
jgi:hypothetical protein